MHAWRYEFIQSFSAHLRLAAGKGFGIGSGELNITISLVTDIIKHLHVCNLVVEEGLS